MLHSYYPTVLISGWVLLIGGVAGLTYSSWLGYLLVWCGLEVNVLKFPREAFL